MILPLSKLKEIIDEQLPLPGSINFDNCEPVIEVPIFRTVGWLSMGNEDDICGMEPGHAEVIREQAGKLVFRKVGKEWELEYFNQQEIEYVIKTVKDRTERMMHERYSKKEEAKPGDSNKPKTRKKKTG